VPAEIPNLVSPQVPLRLAEANAPVRTSVEDLLVVQRQDNQKVLDKIAKLVDLVVLHALLQ
jgi:hypothetical protein